MEILAAASLYNVGVLLVLAFVRSPSLIIVTLIVSGFAWTSTMSMREMPSRKCECSSERMTPS